MTVDPLGVSRRRRRSLAWVYYAIITALVVVGSFVPPIHPAFLLVAVLTGAYSRYLFRGGRFVLWVW